LVTQLTQLNTVVASFTLSATMSIGRLWSSSTFPHGNHVSDSCFLIFSTMLARQSSIILGKRGTISAKLHNNIGRLLYNSFNNWKPAKVVGLRHDGFKS
jgi:hypothetical protein